MFKRIAVVAAVFLAACGTEKVSDAAAPPADPGNGGGGGSIPVNVLLDASTQVKVVVSTTRNVTTPFYDDSGALATCQVDGDCSAFTGATCQAGVCAATAKVPEKFSVANFAKGAQTNFNVPCDGREYVANVFGANSSFEIIERHTSTFTMPAGCVVTPAWTATFFDPSNTSTFAGLPSFVLPDVIYRSGFPSPYDFFNVQVTGIEYPWATSGWTLTHNGPATTSATQIRGNIATFAAPTVSTDLTFEGKFHLDASLLAGSESPTLWTLTRRTPAKATAGAGQVDLP